MDRNGNKTIISYDGSNRITKVTDPVGRTLTFNYGVAREAQSIQDAVGTVASYTYDVAERLTKVVYADGSSLNMTYDQNYMLLSVTDAVGKVLETHTYDQNSWGTSSSRANGVDKVVIQYTADGQAQVVNSKNIVTGYGSATFGGRAYVTSVSGPGCASCGGRNNSSFFYDNHGNRTTSTDALGRATTYTYDANGNVLSSSTQMGNAVINWSYSYNGFGEVLTSTDPMGNTTTNTYDANGNLLTVTSPSTPPSITKFEYNGLGELKKITDPLQNTTTITYTPAGLIQMISDAQGNATTYKYDARGNRTSVQDALGNATGFGYDSMNRLLLITYPDSTTTQFAYDYRGRRISVTDQNSKTTNYAYDDADRLTSVKDAAGNSTQYAYDTENNLLGITDANGHTTNFAYDSLGRVTQTTFPSGLAEGYVYDAVGDLTRKTDRKGQKIGYTYDQLNRLTQKTYPDSTTVNYTYDNDSRLTQVTDATGTYQFTFDNMGRLTGTTTQYSFLGRSFSTSYSYDAASNRVGFTDPEGGSTTYAYDNLNRLQTLTPPSAFTAGAATSGFGFGYDQLSRRTSLTRPNNVMTNYSYDNLSRLLSVLHQVGGSTIDGASYTMDAADNRTAKTDQRVGVTTNYGYDQIYQLLSATQNSTTTESYSYDAVGNRLNALNSSGWSYNASNELTSTPSGSYTYDANGNTLTDAAGRTYTWDFENRLTQVVVPGTGTVSFKYDSLGRRIFKSSSSGTFLYAYDGDNLVEETDGTGAVVGRYSQGLGIDEPLATVTGGASAYYQADGLGSVTSLSTTGGTLGETYAYGSFGKTSSTGSLFNPFQYTGREFDPETGLYYYRARYYDPANGRFLSEDPIGFEGRDSNFYRYSGNRPADFRDYLGLTLDPQPGPGVQGGLDLSNYYEAIRSLGQDPAAAAMIARLSQSPRTYHVVFIHDDNDRYDPTTHTIYWDALSALRCTCGGSQTPANGLYHEMAHAAGAGAKATALANTPDPHYDNLEERRVIQTFETPYSLRHGECVRHDHAGSTFKSVDPTSTMIPLPRVPRPPLPPGLQ